MKVLPQNIWIVDKIMNKVYKNLIIRKKFKEYIMSSSLKSKFMLILFKIQRIFEHLLKKSRIKSQD